MKKILLLSMMALVGLTTSAQFKAQTSVNPQTKTKVVHSSQVQRSFQAVAPRTDVAIKSYLNVNEKFVSKSASAKSIAHLMQSSVAALGAAQPDATTDLVETYNAQGKDYKTSSTVKWQTQNITLTDDTVKTHVFVNFVPTPDALKSVFSSGIIVEFEQEEGSNTITVKPQLLAQGGGTYLILCSGASADGSIVLTKDGYDLKTIDEESIVIGAWSTAEFDPTFQTYLGYYQITDDLSYRSTDAPTAAPKDVLFEPEELVLFAGLGLSGYGYNDNLAIMGAYAPTTFRNRTTDTATGFDWSVKETDANGVDSTFITGNDKDFTLNTKGGAVYEDFSLIASNGEAVSDPFTWGAGHAPANDGSIRYKAVHAYAGKGASSFKFADGTYAVMTRQNPDGDLTFYANFGTPDILEPLGGSSISAIYSYQGKPATPLYLTGVTVPLVSFSADEDFNLHVKLIKCNRDAAGKLKLGDVIAEGDATIENVNDQFAATSGLASVDFTELYVEDEDGMTETVDYLFIEDEFAIVIEDWDNGTFSGVIGAQDIDCSTVTSAWFTKTGDEQNSLYSYSGFKPQLFIGLIDATYGYLYTTDNTNISFDKNAATSTVHVEPMYYDLNEDGKPTYWLEVESVAVDGEEADDIPEWLAIEVANEDYTTATDEDGYEYFVNGIDYDLVFTAEELPADVEKRSCQIVFMQKGARLTITVSQAQDSEDGITSINATTSLTNRQAFNIAGQRVAKDYKGLVIKNGKKYLVK